MNPLYDAWQLIVILGLSLSLWLLIWGLIGLSRLVLT